MVSVSSTNSIPAKAISDHTSSAPEIIERPLDGVKNSTRMCSIFPVISPVSRCNSRPFPVVSESSSVVKTDNLKLIETVDVSAQVTKLLENANIERESASYDQLFTFCKKAIDGEVKIVGLQLAIMSKLLDSKKPVTTAQEISLVNTDSAVGNYAK